MFYQPCLHGVVEKVGECYYVDEKFQKKSLMLMKNSKENMCYVVFTH